MRGPPDFFGQRWAFGYAAARGAARRVFGGELRRESHVPVARVDDLLAVQATPDGAACAMYGTAFTELLRLLVGFEGAMLHVSCRATGGQVCEWRASPPDVAAGGVHGVELAFFARDWLLPTQSNPDLTEYE